MKTMKTFENFTQLEKIPIMEFLQPFIDSNFFIEEELEEDFSEHPNNIINEYIIRDEDMFDYFIECDPDFAYEYVKNWCKKGEGREEETCYCILKRKSDGKNFEIWMHDAGFIGPETLTLCDYAVEVKS